MEKLLKLLEYDKIIGKLSEHASTSLGRELCQKLVPSFYFNEIKNSLDETNEAMSIILSDSSPAFLGIHDIRKALKRAEISSIFSTLELLNIADTLRGSRVLKQYSQNIPSKFNLILEYFNLIYINPSVEDSILKCIDSEDHVSDHASSELLKIRTQIRQAENSIKDKINSIIRGGSYSKYLQENIVTIRNDRYVIPVKQEYRSNVPGLVHDSSATGSTLFIEPIAIVEANNKIHELYIEEKIEIEKILLNLSKLIWAIYEQLTASLNVLAKLDFLFAKAKFAISLNAFSPKLNDYGYINLKKARHPLIEKHKVVPIDVYIGDDFTTLVITGPNTGGKTVTLKTIGLLTLMAYSGMLIPCAENSEIAVFDKIFADIGDEQSIEQSLSTFSGHITNIIKIINASNSNSLILIDELGSGTDPIEGSALAMAILEHLYQKGAKVVASTHYSELKTYALSTPGVKNASCEFDVATLSPTYKLSIGLPGKSNAFAISKKLGLSNEILTKAQSFISSEKTNFENIVSSLQKDKQNLATKTEEIERKLQEISKLQEELNATNQKLSSQKAKIIESAKEEAKEILLSAEEVAKESIREIKNAKKLNETKMNEKFNKSKSKIKEQLSKTYSNAISDDSDFVPFEAKVGMDVYVPSLDEDATILTLPDKDGNLFIQAGILKSKINITKLRPQNTPKETINSVKISVNSGIKATTISPEISLRGLNVEEALYELDKYINDALLANLSTIRIVHGKGEGILKKAVHEYLKSHSNVANYRLGKFGEGDLGVTIAELV